MTDDQFKAATRLYEETAFWAGVERRADCHEAVDSILGVEIPDSAAEGVARMLRDFAQARKTQILMEIQAL